MERLFGAGIRSRFGSFLRGIDSSSEPLVINRNTRVIDSSRVAIAPIDNNNIQSINVSSQNTPVTATVPAPSRQTVGDFVIDTRIVPFIKARRLFVEMIGLRPDMDVNIFFDRVNVNAFCIPAIISNVSGALQTSNFATNGTKGAQQIVDASGRLYFMFDLPPGRFFGGDRELIATDVASLDSLSSSSTQASIIYYGFNFTPRPRAIRPAPVPSRVVTTRSRPRRSSRRRDPLSQTFFVSEELTRGTEGMYVSKVDLFFENKSSSLGVTVELREVINGFPTDSVLPFSRKRLEPNQVSISDNSATSTTFVFDSPVFLASGNEYALAIIPDGANPDYRLWTSEVGAKDVLDSADVTSNWGEGTLFFSTNGSAWTPVQGEDLKFTLYRSKFTSSSSQAVFVNDDYEFMTLSSFTGTPVIGENVFNVSKPVLTTAGATGIVNVSSNIVQGVATNFVVELSIGDTISITSGTSSIIRKVKSIESATSLTMDGTSTFTAVAASIRKAIVGAIEYFNINTLKIHLNESNASAVNKFNPLDVLQTESGDTLTIASIDDKTVNMFQPAFPRQTLNGTTLSLSRTGINRDTTTFANENVILGEDNVVLDNEMIIKSKSNENGSKSISLKATMSIGFESDGTTLRNTISSSIDNTGVAFTAFANAINNDYTDEFLSDAGAALTKYISKRVVLEDGMDAEDVSVIITGYRPVGSNIQVYVKVINSLDNEDFDDKNWSLLAQTSGENLFSDANNLSDYKEFRYAFADRPAATVLVGAIAIDGTPNIAGQGTDFTTSLSVGDSVLIMSDELTNNFQVSRVLSIASDTSLVLEESISMPDNSAATIEKVEDPKTAFKNPQNSNTVRYFDGTGASYDTFKMYAVKIVLLSEKNYHVPKVKDLRVISLSI